MRWGTRPGRIRVAGVGFSTLTLVGWPASVSAHPINGSVDSPLPLELYLGGAALAVAMSFVIGFVHDGRWRPRPQARVLFLPRPIVLLLRSVGLLAWAWVVAQFLVGRSSDAEIGRLFTWVYGWVGLAIFCALLAPAWDWLDPFTTLHDIGSWVRRRLTVARWRPVAYPERLGRWPAVALFAILVWLELVYREADMDMVVVAYTAIALTGMAIFGREPWRARAEVFSVWFGLLGRSAGYASAGPAGSGLIQRQRFPDGLLAKPWDAPLVALVALATGAILFDGLSQTQVFYDLFGRPDLVTSTLLLGTFLGIVVALALGVGSHIGLTMIGAGLLPVSVGYLVAHYLTYLVAEGQWIAVAVADPLQLGWDLTGTAFFTPSTAWLPASVVWGVMICAVVGGHMLGAWAGHHRLEAGSGRQSSSRRAQVPLALVMVGLTTLTLWSLGQVVLADPGSPCARRVPDQREGRSFVARGQRAAPDRLTAEIACP